MWRGRRNVGIPGMGRGRGAHNAQNMALLLLVMRKIQDMDRKPPLTLALMAIMYALHFQKNRFPNIFKSYSLCPDQILANYGVGRLILSAFLHVDDWHLYHNMVSFLWKGYHLEHKLGSVRFGVTIAYLLVLSHLLVVVVAFLLATVAHVPGPLRQCSIGFSGVLFALKVLWNHSAPAHSMIYGFRVPTKYAAWLELVLIHILIPRSSFMGHMCGILAGYIYIMLPGTKSIIASASRWLQLTLLSLVGSIRSERRPPHPQQQSDSPQRTATAGTDEELARRLQEEEFEAAELRQRQPLEQNIDTPPQISQDELRRRRLARFNQTRR